MCGRLQKPAKGENALPVRYLCEILTDKTRYNSKISTYEEENTSLRHAPDSDRFDHFMFNLPQIRLPISACHD